MKKEDFVVIIISRNFEKHYHKILKICSKNIQIVKQIMLESKLLEGTRRMPMISSAIQQIASKINVGKFSTIHIYSERMRTNEIFDLNIIFVTIH